jgi:hypothetical protein
MDYKNMNYKNYFKIIMIFLAVLVIGVVISCLSNDSAKEVRILYVSQDEIIDLEKERLELVGNKANMQLFDGRPDHAIELIELFAADYQDEKAGNIVVFSRGPVSGNKVKSISEELHKKVIKELNEMVANK